MPLCWVAAHAEAMPALRAEENLNAATVQAVGSGGLKRSEASRIVDGWKKASGKMERRNPTVAQIALLGIEVRH